MVWDGGKGESPCLLPMPTNAYERAHVYLDNVSFEGFDPDQRVRQRDFVHSSACQQSRPAGPTLESWQRYGVIEVTD